MLKAIKDTINELKQTTWPTPSALFNLIVYTVVICGIITLLILGLDIFLARVRDIIL